MNVHSRDINDGGAEPIRIITVRMPRSLHEAIRREAAKRQCSMNALCVNLLEFSLAETISQIRAESDEAAINAEELESMRSRNERIDRALEGGNADNGNV